MDFNDSPAEAAFRSEIRAWLEVHAPLHTLPEGTKLPDVKEMARGRAWQRMVYEGGYAGITLPKTLGGRGGSIVDAIIFAEEEARYNLPKGPYIGIGLGMALPVIGHHGSPEQIARFCEATLRGEMTWCQLFSEPSAGSDLANLRTKAENHGDRWIVNGQKVWSSWAHLADWGILVVRTDASVPKHKGLTFFVVDMKSPGIDIRPIRQISGASDFNETFFTDVVIPDSDRIGPVGGGWACCMTVLMGERLGSGSHKSEIATVIQYAAATPRGSGTALDSAAVRSSLAQAFAQEQASKHLESRLRTMVSRGEDPGALAGIIKLSYAGRLQKTSGLAMELRGFSGLAPEKDDPTTLELQHDYIWSTVMRIAGGADEVLRNQISERVLGMPADIRIDKNVPFEQL